MEAVISAYLEPLEHERGSSPVTIRGYRDAPTDVHHRIARRHGVTSVPLRAVTRDDIRAYLSEIDPETSDVNRATSLSPIRGLFACALREGWRADDPARAIARPTVTRRVPDILPVEAVCRLLDAPRGRIWRGWVVARAHPRGSAAEAHRLRPAVRERRAPPATQAAACV